MCDSSFLCEDNEKRNWLNQITNALFGVLYNLKCGKKLVIKPFYVDKEKYGIIMLKR